MGIPSYYRRLVDRLPALITKAHPGHIDWLWMDFNCLIYHCLKAPELRPYPGESGRIEWEEELLEAVVRYTERVVGEVAPKTGVYIAIDGIVPMAKMRQQRLRRFKSSWERAGGANKPCPGEGVGHKMSPPWDSNAITPGTHFMSRLRKMLETVIADRRLPWKLSSADEPGEGEHKLMREWRDSAVGGSYYAVYGLDADLIVLSLLTQDTLSRNGLPINAWLFREDMDTKDEKADTTFSWLNIQLLRDQLRIDLAGSVVTLRDYCFAMSFLGNDFLPVSFSLKLQEGGYNELLAALRRLRKPLLDPRTDNISIGGLVELIGGFADVEEQRVWKAVYKKRMFASCITDEMELGQANWAVSQCVESCLLDLTGSTGRPALVEGWRELYYQKFLGGVKGAVAAETYLKGVQWIWSYYRGEDVCYNWVYPWNVPPLWRDILGWLTERGLPVPAAVTLRAAEIQPVEQLCLVLPPVSASLVPVAGLHRRFAAAAPWLFPAEFGFHSAGKRWFWECEPEIPVPSLLEVKALLREIG